MKIIKRFRYDRGDYGYHITVYAPTAQHPTYQIICNDEECGYHGVVDRRTWDEVVLVVAEILSHADAFEEVAA